MVWHGPSWISCWNSEKRVLVLCARVYACACVCCICTLRSCRVNDTCHASGDSKDAGLCFGGVFNLASSLALTPWRRWFIYFFSYCIFLFSERELRLFLPKLRSGYTHWSHPAHQSIQVERSSSATWERCQEIDGAVTPARQPVLWHNREAETLQQLQFCTWNRAHSLF